MAEVHICNTPSRKFFHVNIKQHDMWCLIHVVVGFGLRLKKREAVCVVESPVLPRIAGL